MTLNRRTFELVRFMPKNTTVRRGATVPWPHSEAKFLYKLFVRKFSKKPVAPPPQNR